MKCAPSKKMFLSILKDMVSHVFNNGSNGGSNGKVLPMNKNGNPERHIKHTFDINNTLLDKDFGLYVEDYFNERLCFERKRTERSQNPFLIMLLNIERLQDNKSEITGELTSILFSSTRETDIKGWYKYDAIIGVIFTEMNGLDKETIKHKILQNMYQNLSVEQMKKIEISFHLFPEKDNEKKSNRPPDLRLYPDISKRTSSNRNRLIFKRAVDITGSIAGFIIFAPFFIIIPILIKLTSKGPVLFRQERIGLNGEKFTFLKFRSMHINNDPKIHREYIEKLIKEQKGYDDKNGAVDQNRVYKITNDPRVTPIGSFLRKTSLDELPQFINVLKGDMSLVGPRPPIHYELNNYDIWHRRRILEVRPGITGLWQVKGRSSTTFNEMVRLDIKYIREWSVWLDIMILIQTPLAVLGGKGAY